MSEARSNFTTFRVNDHEYVCTYYSATKSLEILTRISKHVGEPLGKLFGGPAEEGEGLDAKVEAVLPGVLEALGNRLDRIETVSLIKDILDCLQLKTSERTARVDFDAHFKGRISDVFLVMMEVLKFQYGDLGNVLSGGGGLKSLLTSLKQ